MNDEEIVELYFARDELAVQSTREKYGGLMLSLAEKTLDGQDAEECLNDALLALWNSIPPNRPKSLKAYACKIIRNLSFKRLHYNLAQKRTAASEISLDELEASLADSFSEARFNDLEFVEFINGFVKGLNPEMRAVFIKRYFFLDTLPQIAKDLDINEDKVRSMLFRARKRLKRIMTEKEVLK